MCWVDLDCNIYFWFQKQAIDGLLKDIGIQKPLIASSLTKSSLTIKKESYVYFI